jgi:hypothetical protein
MMLIGFMNPPFTKQQDIDHVAHAYSLLRQGGKLVAVISSAFTFRENRKSVEFRELVRQHGHFEHLPLGTFKDSGTEVATVLVTLFKD